MIRITFAYKGRKGAQKSVAEREKRMDTPKQHRFGGSVSSSLFAAYTTTTGLI